MNKIQKAREYTSPIIEELHNKTDPVLYKRIEKQMMLAVKIDDAIKSKYGSKVAFASVIGKKPSEISRWLTGYHNFTINTLLDLEEKLGIEILFPLEQPVKYPSYLVGISINQPSYLPNQPFHAYGSSSIISLVKDTESSYKITLK